MDQMQEVEFPKPKLKSPDSTILEHGLTSGVQAKTDASSVYQDRPTEDQLRLKDSQSGKDSRLISIFAVTLANFLN